LKESHAGNKTDVIIIMVVAKKIFLIIVALELFLKPGGGNRVTNLKKIRIHLSR